jgi:hypothetical protein
MGNLVASKKIVPCGVFFQAGDAAVVVKTTHFMLVGRIGQRKKMRNHAGKH